MRLSKHFIAREWLIFLALFPFGGVFCFWLGYHWLGFRELYFSESFLNQHSSPLFPTSVGWQERYSPFSVFWNDAFGLKNMETLLLWLIPFLVVTLLRSIAWAIKILRRGNDRQAEVS